MHYDFQTILFAFSLTLLAGLSTGLGAGIAFFSHKDNKKILSIGLGFSAGVMIYVSFVEILAKSKDSFVPIYGEAIGEGIAVLLFFLGMGIAALIDRLVPQDINPHELKKNSEIEILKNDEQTVNILNLKRTGVFMAIAIAIHNFPEGFATFIAALEDTNLGIMIALAIAIHNIPEGIAVSLPIYHATGNKKQAFWYAFSSGLTEPIGAFVGFMILLPFLGKAALGVTFGLVAGIMIYISFDELLPSARVYGNAHTTILGIALGMFMMAASLILFKIL